MDQRLYDVLNGRESNHLLPFFWMHEGNTDRLADLVQEVYDSGARALCVESRPHEGFCRDSWWADMDIILKKAAELDMKVWILDDKHFPTGFANGMAAEKYPEKRSWHLIEEHVDVMGPSSESAILLREHGGVEEELIGVYACRRVNEVDETISAEAIDLTANVRGRYVFWDIPEGVYRIFALYKSRLGELRKDYIHMIDADAVRVQIEAVYEPHYEHYQRYFGNTLAGFFSDEPCLGNGRWTGVGLNPGFYGNQLGQPGLALPWSDEVPKRMQEKLGREVTGLLPGLWYSHEEGAEELRLCYMDVITTLWKENFSYQLGDWCRAHGVQYIGHIIEDMNSHARMSYSAGHFFRSLDGQDMAGIDVVLHQIIPGMAHYSHAACVSGGVAESEFFDYTLARLAASHSHIQPRMAGRVMCEIFGAYGWAEGVPFMKHLLDHMLVRGVNEFVPHAFSPKYPDPDCPPHFGGGGHNPEFQAYSCLMKYANQVSHLLTGGTEVVSAAILYHAEAEWCGRDYMLMQKPAKALYDAQLNYDILPIDALMEQATVENGQLAVEEMRYPALIVPYAQYLPAPFLKKLHELEAQGLKLAFVDGRPEGYTGGAVIPLHDVAGYVRHVGGGDVRLEKPFDLLRFMHIRRDGHDVFMLVNESMQEEFAGEVVLPLSGTGVALDLLSGAMHRIEARAGRVNLKLASGESVILIFGGELPENLTDAPEITRAEVVDASWTLALRRATEAEYAPAVELASFYNVTGIGGDPDFSGWMRYEAEFTAGEGAKGIDLGRVGECAQVWLNGRDLGHRIAAPYTWLTDIQPGKNHLIVEVSNNLVHETPDKFSTYMQIGPSGLMGEVRVLY